MLIGLKSSMRKLVPVFRCGSQEEGRWSSLRWLGTGRDSLVFKDGTRFIQWGKNPVKFSIWLAKDRDMPTFMMDHKWHIIAGSSRFMVGVTYKPLNFAKYWRHNENRTREKTVRATALLS